MKNVYMFNEGNKDLKDLLGGKGANLAEMTNLGLPVPYGFTISTNICNDFYKNNLVIEENAISEIFYCVKKLEENTNKKFNGENPLLVSVRSGAKFSMPGMMDTILNLGMNDYVCETIGKKANDYRFSYDLYRRFIEMYSDVVMNLPREKFSLYFLEYKKKMGYKHDYEYTVEDLKKIVKYYKKIYLELTGKDFPSDIKEQIIESVKAVFKSFNSERANHYRKINNIPNNIGTAVNIQEMVYGNMGSTSLTGVCFSRNPNNGENTFYGEFLENSQGEDIVAGVRTPKNIMELKNINICIYDELYKYAKKLENHYKDMQDIEFTVMDNKLYILQTRNGKRSPKASIRILNDLLENETITEKEYIDRIDINSIEKILHPSFDSEELKNSTVLATGIGASSGASSGYICFSTAEAKENIAKGIKNLILVRNETSADDIEGMNIVNGILTVRGGMTSHAAVVARGMGKTCVCGCEEISVNEEKKQIKFKNNLILKTGDVLSLDGSTGNIYNKLISLKNSEVDNEFVKLMKIINRNIDIEVKTNAETVRDMQTALNLTADGIGLCRTEHMFFEKNKMLILRKMILSEENEKNIYLSELKEIQKNDFINIFKVIKDKSITIRYLDPPMHEFLPKKKDEISELAKSMNKSSVEIEEKINTFKQSNPMLGLRGCRLLITKPKILIMQTESIILAMYEAMKLDIKPNVELMIPLVSCVEELVYLRNIINLVIEKYEIKLNINLNIKIGVMMETPRSCLISDEISKMVQFYSFGTNDLTQMTYGFSRDDISSFSKNYKEKNILSIDPFKQIDKSGVLKIINYAIIKGKENNKNLEIGVCGEQGSDYRNTKLFIESGVNYLSVTPYKIPLIKIKLAKIKNTKSK